MPTPCCIGVIGSRRRNTPADYRLVERAILRRYRREAGDYLVSGGCPRGADWFAERIAEARDIPILIHPARWDRDGRAAGFIRNTYIARDADLLIACVAPDRTGGTEDTIRRFCALGKGVWLVLV